MTVAALPSNLAHSDFEDDDDDLTPAGWLFDVLLIPALVLLLVSLVALGASAAIWATLKVWAAIWGMIN